MTLDGRRDVVQPVLDAVLGSDADAIDVTTSRPWLLISVRGEAGFAVGFDEGMDGETAAQTAIRLVEILATDLPTTRRFWGRPIPECHLPGHVHALEPRAVEELTVTLCCPATGRVATTITLPAPA